MAFLLNCFQRNNLLSLHWDPGIISMCTQNKQSAKGFPRERCSAHSVYYPPQLLISCFAVLWETTLYEQEDRSAHKNCNRTLFKPAGTLLTPQPSSKTEHFSCLLLLCSFATSYFSHLFSYSSPLLLSPALLHYLVRRLWFKAPK